MAEARSRATIFALLGGNEFAVMFESAGKIGMITKWVLRRAIEDCAGWNRAGSARSLHHSSSPG
jgi:EAL domain-containing protein (putative c-di-GMP-specific phosphodiesterase class I)